MARIEKQSEVPADPNFVRLVQAFIAGGKEKEQTVDNVIGQMLEEERGGLWLIKQDDEVLGFVFATVFVTEQNTNAIMIHSAYVDPRVRRNVLPDIQNILFDWGRIWNVKDLYFLTRRNPKSFARRLKADWTLDSYVMRRRLPEKKSG